MSKRSKSKRKKRKIVIPAPPKLNCMDCGKTLDPVLAFNIESTKKHLNMPNMMVFCDDCQFKIKNKFRRIWNGIKFLFE